MTECDEFAKLGDFTLYIGITSSSHLNKKKTSSESQRQGLSIGERIEKIGSLCGATGSHLW